MKIPLSWLKEHIPITLSPDDIAKVLTMAGLEVEHVEKMPLRFQGVVVGRVTDVKKHPNAERLCVATVTDGREYFQVVCGAPNCHKGLKTAFAKIGATLFDKSGKAFKIKKTKLRGEDSCGMLCSAKELGLSEEEDKIIEFSDEYVEGKDLEDFFSDALLEIALTPNLNHCASIMGIARELSALTAHPIRYPVSSVKEGDELLSTAVNVHNQAQTGCPRYCCRVIKGVRVGPSPQWLQDKLTACGLRSVNNVVDVTNFVLMESGYPLHAFDYDKIHLHTLVIRTAQENETFTTLDGVCRKLTADDLLIADPEKPLALGGVMGGLESEVSEKTVNVLLEAAAFNPTAIRRTSKRQGIISEASKRFEKGVDPQQAIASLNRAAALILEVAGGTVLKGIIDINEAPYSPKTISCSISQTNRILGTQLGLSEIETIFQRLQFRLKYAGQDLLQVQVPSYRHDLNLPIDLVEEVARIYGYNHIPKPALRYGTSAISHSPISLFEWQVKEQLIEEGLQEFLTCDLISPQQADLITGSMAPKDAIIHLMNPTSLDQSVLRPSLLPGLLQAIRYNLDHQNYDISAFETGRIHFKEGDHYKEQTACAIILSGQCRPSHWDRKSEMVDFYDLKGIVENLLAALGIARSTFKESELIFFHPGRQTSIMSDNVLLGVLGEVHPSLLRNQSIEQRVYYAELNLHDLLPLKRGVVQMKELPSYPSSSRDWTITLDEETKNEEITNAISSMRSYLLEKFSLTDIYHSDELGHGRKNATINFIYRDPKKTLSDEEIKAEHNRLITGVIDKLKTR